MEEVRIEDAVVVDAPASVVWQQIHEPARHAAWHPFVTRIDGEHRLGATRSCDVALGKRRARTRERCVAEEPPERIEWRVEEDTSGFLRLVADWTAGFRLEPTGDEKTRVTAASTFRPKNVVVRLMLPAVRRKFHQTQRAILAALADAAHAAAALERDRPAVTAD